MPAPSPEHWLVRLQRRADAPPLQPRIALRLAGADDTAVGSVEPALAAALAADGLPVRIGASGCVVEGDPDASLERLAQWLHENGRASRWRNERLAVCDAAGRVHAAIERAAVRPLGITTQAVHLVGRRADGGWWLQRRALDKATDPGLWDTLMGGLVAAGEDIATTLARETWEEAGLRVDALAALAPLGRITVRRPVTEGYMVEHIEMFQAWLPARLQPLNQDGEVMAFECIDAAALRERLAADRFTLEAALILAHALGHRVRG